MKYRWRKKYTEEKAKEQIQMTKMMIESCKETILTFRLKEDKLIQAMLWKSRIEIIEENEMQIEYLISKINYMRKFIKKI